MQKFFLLLLLAFVFGCTKNHRSEPDTEKPLIVLVSPTGSPVFTAGQQFTISASITDNSKIEEVHLEIVNETTSATYTHEHFAPGSGSYSLSRSISLPSAGAYKVRIEAEDTARNESQIEFRITIN